MTVYRAFIQNRKSSRDLTKRKETVSTNIKKKGNWKNYILSSKRDFIKEKQLGNSNKY